MLDRVRIGPGRGAAAIRELPETWSGDATRRRARSKSRRGCSRRRRFGFAFRWSIRCRGAMIGHSREAGKAHPVVSGCFNVSVRGRLDFLTLRSGLLKAPVTFPVISLSYEGCMFGGDARDAELACAVVAGATAPLAVEDFESARARGDVAILEAA